MWCTVFWAPSVIYRIQAPFLRFPMMVFVLFVLHKFGRTRDISKGVEKKSLLRRFLREYKTNSHTGTKGNSLEEPLISSTVYWALSIIYGIEALFQRFPMMLFVLHRSYENETYGQMSPKLRGWVLSPGGA